jgi:hypothetical protein
MAELTLQDAGLAVYDDVLPAEDFARVWQYVQGEQYRAMDAAGWSKVWRLTDGSPLGSAEFDCRSRPFSTALDVAAEAILRLADQHPKLLGGNQGDGWTDLTLRSYLYPRGSRLSWHIDGSRYAGACVFYTHPVWRPAWGGELLVADVRADYPLPRGRHLDHAEQDACLMERGLGTFLFPRPNRLVLLRSGAAHGMARVDDDAGDHVRASLTGFFLSADPARRWAT